MTSPLKIDARNDALVTDGSGNLILNQLPQDFYATVKVQTYNPACSEDGSGWYVAWRVRIGGGAQVEDGVAHNWRGGNENTDSDYSGTITFQNSKAEVLLQLRAWHGDETTPGKDPQPITPADIRWRVSIGDESRSGTFAATNPSQEQGHWVDGALYWRVLCEYDFLNEKWLLIASVEGGEATP